MGVCVGGGGHSQSRSSSYSAVVTDRKPQVDVMSPASLLTCLLPLHNRSQINVKYDFWVQSVKREEEKRERRGERRHRLSPNGGLLQLKNCFVFFKNRGISLHGAETTPRTKSGELYETPWCLNVKRKRKKKGHFVKQLMRASLSARFRIIFSTEDSSPPSSFFFFFFSSRQHNSWSGDVV